MDDKKTFYAHSTPRPNQSDWQRLQDHLQAVGELAAQRADVFGAAALASISGQLHDLGKYTEKFQQRLVGGAPVDHSTWGAKIANDRFGAIGTLLAYGIAGHHAGLANGRDAGERLPLQDRLRSTLPALDPLWQQEIALPAHPLSPPTGFSINKERGQSQLAFLGRMLFAVKRRLLVEKK